MNWDVVFWAWFVVTIIFSVIMLIGNHLSQGYMFFLQLMVIIGLALVKLSGRVSLDVVRKVQSSIYEFWLKISKMEIKPKVKRKILDKL